MNLVRGTIQSTEITKFPVSMEMLTNPMLAVIFKPVFTFYILTSVFSIDLSSAH